MKNKISNTTKSPQCQLAALRSALMHTVCLFSAIACSMPLNAQESSSKDKAKLKNALPLPTTGKTPAKTSSKSSAKSRTTRTPPTKSTRQSRLASSMTIVDDDLLLDEDSQLPAESDEDAGWEKVTPVPVKPADKPDAEWLKRQGVRIPRPRETYPLEENQPAKPDQPVPSRNNPNGTAQPPSRSSQPDAAYPPEDNSMEGELIPQEERSRRRIEPYMERQSQELQRDEVGSNQSNEAYPEPRMRDWSGVTGSFGNLSQQLNATAIDSQSTCSNPISFAPLDCPPPACPPPMNGLLRKRVDDHLSPQYSRYFSAKDCPPGGSNGACPQPYYPDDFAPTIVYDLPPNPAQELESYYGKTCIPTPRPPIELFRPFYGDGIFSPAIPVFSDVNPLMPQFLVYGDYRVGAGFHSDVQGNEQRSVANRLAIDMDLRLTGTERLHAFMAPLDNNGQFTRIDFSNRDDVRFESEMDAQFETGFFEGDLGAMFGGLTGQDAPFDLPVAVGLMPMLYQNGIWMEDVVAGAAIALPWRHSRPLNWNNYDITFFAFLDQVTTPAFDNNNGVASVFGTAWFIEAYEGYIEADYAFVQNRVEDDLSYHNISLAYTRRYLQYLSNSIRVINNIGQEFDVEDRTADGTLLLIENAFRTSKYTTVIPYANVFVGFRRPQSVARAAAAGGILRNTGILFEPDNLTNFPTLDASGNGTYGGAVGLNLFASDFRQQLVIEAAALDRHGDEVFSNVAGAEYGAGARYQRAINNWSILRLDGMVGFRDGANDIYGSRVEWRRKF